MTDAPRTVELQVLTKIAATQDLDPFLRAGMTPAWFSDPACRRGFEVQLEHHTAHQKAGTWKLYEAHALGLQQQFAPDDSPETLAEALRVSTLQVFTRRATSRFLEEADIGEVPFQEAYSRLLDGVTAQDVMNLMEKQEGGTLVGSWDRFLAAEQYHRASHGLLGIPFPWPSLTAQTGGIQPSDYAVYAGFRKARKTDLGVETIVVATQEYGEPTLVITNELSFDQMLYRVACRWAKVPYARFRNGSLSDGQRQHLHAVRKQLEHEEQVAIRHVTATGLGAIGQVLGLIRQHKPALVLWDGHQLSAASDDWKDVYQLSRRTRRLCLEAGVPIIPTVQLDPKKKEASYKAYLQDATVAIRITKEGDWTHCEATEVRDGNYCRWSIRCERGLPLIEQPYLVTGDGTKSSGMVLKDKEDE